MRVDWWWRLVDVNPVAQPALYFNVRIPKANQEPTGNCFGKSPYQGGKCDSVHAEMTAFAAAGRTGVTHKPNDAPDDTD